MFKEDLLFGDTVIWQVLKPEQKLGIILSQQRDSCNWSDLNVSSFEIRRYLSTPFKDRIWEDCSQGYHFKGDISQRVKFFKDFRFWDRLLNPLWLPSDLQWPDKDPDNRPWLEFKVYGSNSWLSHDSDQNEYSKHWVPMFTHIYISFGSFLRFDCLSKAL